MFKLLSPKIIQRSIYTPNSQRYITSQAYTDALTLLKTDLKQAMLNKDNVKKTTIRNLLSTIKNREIESKDIKLNEFILFDIYSKLMNQRRESIAEFIKNNREELVEKEQKEIDIIKKYLHLLPVASNEEIDEKVSQYLIKLKRKDPNLQLKQVLGNFDWEIAQSEWKASPSAIKSSIVSNLKRMMKM